MKRIIVLLIVALLALSVACGKGDRDKTEEKQPAVTPNDSVVVVGNEGQQSYDDSSVWDFFGETTEQQPAVQTDYEPVEQVDHAPAEAPQNAPDPAAANYLTEYRKTLNFTANEKLGDETNVHAYLFNVPAGGRLVFRTLSEPYEKYRAKEYHYVLMSADRYTEKAVREFHEYESIGDWDAETPYLLSSSIVAESAVGTPEIPVRLKAGSYVFLITGKRGNTTPEVGYSLDFRFEPDAGPGETEWNDTPETANALTLNQGVTGNINDYYSTVTDRRYDVDYYRFTLTEKTIVRMVMQLPPKGQYKVTISETAADGSKGKDLVYADLYTLMDEPREDRSGAIELNAGTYFVRVEMRGASGVVNDRDYTLIITTE